MQGILEEVTLLQDITEACRSAVRAFVEERTDDNDQVRTCAWLVHRCVRRALVLC